MTVAAAKREIVPKKDPELSAPISVKFPRSVLERIDATAAATGNSRSATINYLVAWALDENDKKH